ncbi:hypothetical protein NEPAR06_0994 [Nematocida parisii]|uniref:Uncharacterized protein n=1 Tax=Nematocida parisii (strain ERTm3) TaxID=935791 RepID=I3EFM3_NEMP3|nr:uncharacterized protein NEPG_01486 [Nematocida parisii ERTm1]EIJ88020.1 hypothetical protein NEQG_01464 [Nematocida parisii ERTm3]KAI5128404.1 hypothetical protein NEPAR08_1215 [Nematocida parisii]EIJ93914.1 hypothetical protein NEPG_01486 [Nematocida parisii ERTm1]KAI5128457.1 hypothetical protein NEPAR03_1311 [Nematocida parisii]KAI5143415.1 hypothetical protein NEPAR04_1806 [Nematocida parisii]|eukprot:XP_013059314.1 hypothetical protein NEPG_01486 [Nematocida parisii ERTm1]
MHRRQLITNIIEILVLVTIVTVFSIIAVNIIENWNESEVPPTEDDNSKKE